MIQGFWLSPIFFSNLLTNFPLKCSYNTYNTKERIFTFWLDLIDGGVLTMAVIKLYNLYSEIEEASAQSISAVDRELSVLTPGHKFTPSFKRGNWDGRTKFFKNNKKTKSFPTGLLSYVVKAINSAGEEVKIVDERLGSIIEVPEKIDLIDNSKGHITLRDYQHDAVESALEASRGVLHLATNAGKCITEDTLILTEQGYKSVSQIFHENGTPCENVVKQVPAKVNLINRYGEVETACHLTFNGEKDILKITTDSGLKTTITNNHPLLTVTDLGEFEWVLAEDIKSDMLLVTRRGDEIYGLSTVVTDVEEAYFLGAIIADGYTGHERKISFTNNQEPILSSVENYLNTCGGVRVYREIDKRSTGITVAMSGVDAVQELYKRLDIPQGVAKDKRVPQHIMESPKEIQLAFLSGYLECECSINISQMRMEVTSASNTLMEQVQLLLKNMGIIAFLEQRKPSKAYPDTIFWRLNIYSRELDILLGLMSFKSEQRITQQKETQEVFNSTRRRPIKDNVPNGKYFIDQYDKTFVNPPKGARKKMHAPKNISTHRMRELLDLYPEGNKELKAHIESIIDENIFLDKVVSVEDCGVRRTFDVSMPMTHSFIANSIVNHNTECACGIIKCILPTLKEGQRIAFFTHSKEIFIQSHLRLEERLGIKVGKVGMGKWDVKQVTVVMIPTLSKYMDKPKGAPNTSKLKKMHKEIKELNEDFVRTSSKADKKALKDKMEIVMKEKTDYEKEQQDKIMEKHKDATDLINSIYVMIGDEVHHASSETWYKLFMKLKNAHYRFGLTGTVDEESEGHEINLFRLLGCTGKIVSTVSNDFLINKGYSAKPIIYMMTIPGISNIDNVRYQTARKLGIIENDARNLRFVTKIVERAKSGKQCLVIVNETQHGDILYKMLKGRIEDIAFSHGETTDTHRDECLQGLKDGTISVLIATTILDEGVDVSGINCLFLVAGGKSPRQLLQRIGRGLRKKDDGSNLEVYDSLDYHNEYLVDHTYSRFNSYQSEGFDIIRD